MDNCENSTLSTKSKVPFDPGWNDPPTFTYNSQQSTPNRPRNFLNKRVAFPLNNNSSVQSSLPTPVNLPPVAPPLVNKNVSISAVPDMVTDSENIVAEVKEVLLGLLESSSELGQKADSIRKKINIMDEMWKSGKLNIQVQRQMMELSLALKEENPNRADDIHKALMVDHVSSVGTWMPAIKQLIYHSIAKLELLAIDKEN